MEVEEVVIAGAGIAGLATALALKRVGIRALVLEKADQLRATGAALTLFPNAWIALRALGVSQKLTPLYSSFHRGHITNVSTGATQEVSFTASDSDECGVRTVHRRALLEALAEELPSGTIRFSSKLTSIHIETQEGSTITVIDLEKGISINAKVLIGCDGVHSIVAQWLGLNVAVNSGRWAVRALAMFPEGHSMKHKVEQFVDVGKRAGVVSITDKEVYWFLCVTTSPGEVEDMALRSDPETIRREIVERYATGFPASFLDTVAHTDLSTLSWAPLMFRYPWDVLSGALSKGGVTVAGDAMHPMTPDLGQGGCSALEDAVVLGRHVGELYIRNGGLVLGKTDVALQGYVKERRWRVAKLIAGSYLSGWAQQGQAGRLANFIRDVFYKFFFNRLSNSLQFDCGTLPSADHPAIGVGSKN